MKRLTLALLTLALGSLSFSAAAMDAAAADKLVRKSKCMTCHKVDVKKDGPSYKEVAEKHRGKADAMEKLTKHVTVASKVKVEGREEEHETLKTDDAAEVKNVVEWILSL